MFYHHSIVVYDAQSLIYSLAFNVYDVYDVQCSGSDEVYDV